MRWQTIKGNMLLLVIMGVAVAWAQQKKPELKPGATLTIEGQITQLDLSTPPGPPALTVKTAEGTEYTVHIGPLAGLKSQGFNPKVGDKITITGAYCCEIQGKTVIHSSELALGGKTFRTPNSMMAPSQGMGPMSQGKGMGTPAQNGMGMNMGMQGNQGTGMGAGMGMMRMQQGQGTGMGSGMGTGVQCGCCSQQSEPSPETGK